MNHDPPANGPNSVDCYAASFSLCSAECGLFLATLELMKQHRIRITQDKVAGEIKLSLRPETEWNEDAGDDLSVSDETEGDSPSAPEASNRWLNPETGEIDYDWPSDEIRQRVEKRANLRAKRGAKLRRGESVEELDEDEIIDLDEDDFDELDDSDLNDSELQDSDLKPEDVEMDIKPDTTRSTQDESPSGP